MTTRSSLVILLALALAIGCGGAAPSETPAQPTAGGETAGTEPDGRARARTVWNDELARLRADALLASSYDARAAELASRAPTQAECAELDVLVARANEVGCDVADPRCARPSDRAPTPDEVSSEPTFDHGCPMPASSSRDPAVGGAIPSDEASRLEGCSAAWTTWLFERCPE